MNSYSTTALRETNKRLNTEVLNVQEDIHSDQERVLDFQREVDSLFSLEITNFLRTQSVRGISPSSIDADSISAFLDQPQDISDISDSLLYSIFSSYVQTSTAKDLSLVDINRIITLNRFRHPQNIADVSRSLYFLGYKRCAKRIEFLENTDDFEEGEKPLSLESTKSFLSFVSNPKFSGEFKKLGEPLLGFSWEGILDATWKASDSKYLHIQFHSSQIISFAMIRPDSNSPDGKFRLNGRGTPEGVIATLHKQDVVNWRAD